MADSKHLKRVDPVELSDDDPFAELVNIMGFDPRVQVRHAAEPKTTEIATPDEDIDPRQDDLAMDLEKELVGEPVPEENSAFAPEYEPVEVSAAVEPVAEDVELLPHMDAAPVDEFHGGAEPAFAVPTPARVELPDQEPLLSESDFDAAFEGGFAASDEDFPAISQNEQAVGQDAPILDDAAFPDVLNEPGKQVELRQDTVARSGREQFLTQNDEIERNRYPEKDESALAMAEVDMSFDRDRVHDRPSAFQREGEKEISQAGHGLYDRGEIDFDGVEDASAWEAQGFAAEMGAEHALSQEFEPQYLKTGEEMPAAPVGTTHPVEDKPHEPSLEDELNALLGNSSSVAIPPVEDEISLPGSESQSGSSSTDVQSEYDSRQEASARLEVFSARESGQTSPRDEVGVPDAAGLEFDEYAFDAAFTAGLVEDMAEPVSLRNEAWEEPVVDARKDDTRPLTAAEDVFLDIDTVDVPERAVAVADDLDIPHVVYEDEPRPVPVLDEFEKEFAAVFAEPVQPEVPVASQDDNREQEPAEAEMVVENTGYDDFAGIGSGTEFQRPFDGDSAMGGDFEFDASSDPRMAVSRDSELFGVDEYESMDVEDVPPPPYADLRRAPRRRIPAIALLVGGVAILGGIGALALSFGGGVSDTPALVKADESPIKVKPENPGGTTVPNQDSTVYDSVAGAEGVNTPARQESLVTSAEEPVDVAAQIPAVEPAPEDMSGVDEGEALDSDDEIGAIVSKDEDRIAPSPMDGQAATNEEPAAVAPRRVRTLIVRSDGSMVPREEEPAPAPTSAQEAAPERVAVDSPASTPNAAPSGRSSTPDSVPVAPSRPADQPVNVVGSIGGNDQVASVTPAAAAPMAAQPAGDWFMQIASQPNEESAKSTLQALSRKHASVLGGHNATIVKAEIAGKGTFWRIRVPAGSRENAISLCESYKASGGSCFVTK